MKCSLFRGHVQCQVQELHIHVNNHMYNIYIYMCRYKYYISKIIYIFWKIIPRQETIQGHGQISWIHVLIGVITFNCSASGISSAGENAKGRCLVSRHPGWVAYVGCWWFIFGLKKMVKTLGWHHIEWEHIEGLSFYWVTFKQDPMS